VVGSPQCSHESDNQSDSHLTRRRHAPTVVSVGNRQQSGHYAACCSIVETLTRLRRDAPVGGVGSIPTAGMTFHINPCDSKSVAKTSATLHHRNSTVRSFPALTSQ